MEESPFSCDPDRERDGTTEHRPCQRRKWQALRGPYPWRCLSGGSMRRVCSSGPAWKKLNAVGYPSQSCLRLRASWMNGWRADAAMTIGRSSQRTHCGAANCVIETRPHRRMSAPFLRNRHCRFAQTAQTAYCHPARRRARSSRGGRPRSRRRILHPACAFLGFGRGSHVSRLTNTVRCRRSCNYPFRAK
jgi:hypothetical protein